jgi:hypothetical protein
MLKHPTTPLTPAGPADLAWVAGRWRGQRKGDVVEEHWSAPAAESVMGMFRWMRGGAVRFFELLTLERAGEGVAMHIKHFSPGLKGWEEKDEATTFDLVALTGTRAVFFQRAAEKTQWLVYHRAGDALTVFFEPDGAEHKSEDEFNYQWMTDEV